MLEFLPPLLIVLLALLLDFAAGDPGWLYKRVWHPVVFVGKGIDLLEKQLNQRNFPRSFRLAFGGLTVVIIVGLAWWLGSLIAGLTKSLAYFWIFEVLLASSLLAFRGLYDFIKPVQTALQTGDLAAAQTAVSHVVGRDPKRLDRHGVARASVESLAENYSDGAIAPLFWYLLLGLPGLFAYKAINTLDSMIGHRNQRFEAFGKVAAYVDDWANFLPARLTALLLATTAKLRFGASLAVSHDIITQNAPKHRSPNAGWPESAMAAALGLKLAGPRDYGSYTVNDDWIGEGTTQAEARHLAKGFQLYWATSFLVAGLIIVALVL